MLFYERGEQRRRRERAERINDMAHAFGGTQSKDGFKGMTAAIAALREE